MTDKDQDTTRTPVARSSLQVERDQFLGTFFKKGAKITREILDENQRLRGRVSELELEIAAMKLQVKSNDAIRELLVKVQELEKEKVAVLEKLEEVRQRSTRVEATRQEAEEELTNLASLYVASRQLHASSTVDEVLQRVSEILEQLIGAHTYALYMRQPHGDTMICVLERNTKSDHIERYQQKIREVMLTGTSAITEDLSVTQTQTGAPLAYIPLHAGDKSAGILIIERVLPQKISFVPIDYELFELLRSQAARALISAQLSNVTSTGIAPFSRTPLSDAPPMKEP